MNEFWLWVSMAVVTIIVGKVTGLTISQWVQRLFGQTIDYLVMILLVYLVWQFPSILQECDKTTMLIRGVVIGHWFWHEDSGGIITRGWLIDKVKGWLR